MDKAEIRVKAEQLLDALNEVEQTSDALVEIMDALTQAYEEGDKKDYKRGWDEAIKAVVAKRIGLGTYALREIRRLRIEEK